MSSYTWENRVIIIFGDATDAQLKRQKELLLAEKDGLDERDMVVFAVIGTEKIEPVHGRAPSTADAKALRQNYGVDENSPFTIVLIGKDGAVKWREERPVDARELFALIDSMPTRQLEI